MVVRPFLAEDMAELQLRKEQADHQPILSPESAKAVEDEISFTVLCNGVICAIFGLLIPWEGRGQGWAFIGHNTPRRAWPEITQRLLVSMQQLMKGLRLNRLEISVAADHDAAIHWAERLGFTREGKMVKYGPDGSDFFLYALTV